jgi:hypothetical protein
MPIGMEIQPSADFTAAQVASLLEQNLSTLTPQLSKSFQEGYLDA